MNILKMKMLVLLATMFAMAVVWSAHTVNAITSISKNVVSAFSMLTITASITASIKAAFRKRWRESLVKY